MRFKFLQAAVVGLMLSVCTIANAGLILDVDSNGQLNGAANVNINGVLYDVKFVDGTCIDVFTGCDDSATDFNFTTADGAVDSLNALYNQVFIDTENGSFSSPTSLVNGCEKDYFCYIGVPFELYYGYHYEPINGDPNYLELVRDEYQRVNKITLVDWREDYNDRDNLFLSNYQSDYDTSGNENVTWAHFTRTGIVNSIPEPSTLAIFALGIMGLASRRFKK